MILRSPSRALVLLFCGFVCLNADSATTIQLSNDRSIEEVKTIQDFVQNLKRELSTKEKADRTASMMLLLEHADPKKIEEISRQHAIELEISDKLTALLELPEWLDLEDVESRVSRAELFSHFVKTHCGEDIECLRMVMSQIQKETRFRVFVQSLWQATMLDESPFRNEWPELLTYFSSFLELEVSRFQLDKLFESGRNSPLFRTAFMAFCQELNLCNDLASQMALFSLQQDELSAMELEALSRFLGQQSWVAKDRVTRGIYTEWYFRSASALLREDKTSWARLYEWMPNEEELSTRLSRAYLRMHQRLPADDPEALTADNISALLDDIITERIRGEEARARYQSLIHADTFGHRHLITLAREGFFLSRKGAPYLTAAEILLHPRLSNDRRDYALELLSEEATSEELAALWKALERMPSAKDVPGFLSDPLIAQYIGLLRHPLAEETPETRFEKIALLSQKASRGVAVSRKTGRKMQSGNFKLRASAALLIEIMTSEKAIANESQVVSYLFSTETFQNFFAVGARSVITKAAATALNARKRDSKLYSSILRFLSDPYWGFTSELELDHLVRALGSERAPDLFYLFPHDEGGHRYPGVILSLAQSIPNMLPTTVSAYVSALEALEVDLESEDFAVVGQTLRETASAELKDAAATFRIENSGLFVEVIKLCEKLEERSILEKGSISRIQEPLLDAISFNGVELSYLPLSSRLTLYRHFNELRPMLDLEHGTVVMEERRALFSLNHPGNLDERLLALYELVAKGNNEVPRADDQLKRALSNVLNHPEPLDSELQRKYRDQILLCLLRHNYQFSTTVMPVLSMLEEKIDLSPDRIFDFVLKLRFDERDLEASQKAFLERLLKHYYPTQIDADQEYPAPELSAKNRTGLLDLVFRYAQEPAHYSEVEFLRYYALVSFPEEPSEDFHRSVAEKGLLHERLDYFVPRMAQFPWPSVNSFMKVFDYQRQSKSEKARLMEAALRGVKVFDGSALNARSISDWIFEETKKDPDLRQHLSQVTTDKIKLYGSRELPVEEVLKGLLSGRAPENRVYAEKMAENPARFRKSVLERILQSEHPERELVYFMLDHIELSQEEISSVLHTLDKAWVQPRLSYGGRILTHDSDAILRILSQKEHLNEEDLAIFERAAGPRFYQSSTTDYMWSKPRSDFRMLMMKRIASEDRLLSASMIDLLFEKFFLEGNHRAIARSYFHEEASPDLKKHIEERLVEQIKDSGLSSNNGQTSTEGDRVQEQWLELLGFVLQEYDLDPRSPLIMYDSEPGDESASWARAYVFLLSLDMKENARNLITFVEEFVMHDSHMSFLHSAILNLFAHGDLSQVSEEDQIFVLDYVTDRLALGLPAGPRAMALLARLQFAEAVMDERELSWLYEHLDWALLSHDSMILSRTQTDEMVDRCIEKKECHTVIERLLDKMLEREGDATLQARMGRSLLYLAQKSAKSSRLYSTSKKALTDWLSKASIENFAKLDWAALHEMAKADDVLSDQLDSLLDERFLSWERLQDFNAED